jgi:uncharacterized membrane protein (DUF4010 family)
MEMQAVHSDEFQPWAQLAASLAIGFLIGLERQRNPTAKAGVRTCALVALFGAIAALLSQALGTAWILAAGLLLSGAMIIAAYVGPENHEADSGTTTVIAVLLCYCLGAMVWFGYMKFAVALAIAITVLLHFKAQLHEFSEKLAPHDISMMLQFAVLSFIVLPLLPDEGYGPYRALNPYHTWLMVVLVSGLSVAGYLALRVLGGRRGLLVVGLAGGLVSSTATTVVQSRQAGLREEWSAASASVIAISNLVVLARLSVLALVSAPAIVPLLLPALAAGVACGLPTAIRRFRGATSGSAVAVPEVSNPASVPVALGFGALYAAVLLLSAWLSDRAGEGALLGLAAVSAVVDLDAITLSTLRLFSTGIVAADIAATAVVVAFLAASLSKLAIIGWLGGARLVRLSWLPLLAPVVGAAAVLWLMPKG